MRRLQTAVPAIAPRFPRRRYQAFWLPARTTRAISGHDVQAEIPASWDTPVERMPNDPESAHPAIRGSTKTETAKEHAPLSRFRTPRSRSGATRPTISNRATTTRTRRERSGRRQVDPNVSPTSPTVEIDRSWQPHSVMLGHSSQSIRKQISPSSSGSRVKRPPSQVVPRCTRLTFLEAISSLTIPPENNTPRFAPSFRARIIASANPTASLIFQTRSVANPSSSTSPRISASRAVMLNRITSHRLSSLFRGSTHLRIRSSSSPAACSAPTRESRSSSTSKLAGVPASSVFSPLTIDS